MPKPVKTQELVRILLEERVRFAPWDDCRRTKVDIILEAIKRNKKNASLNDLEKSVAKVAHEKEELKELKDTAIKLLRIHYLSLSRTDDEQEDYIARRERALQKIKEYEERFDTNKV